MNPIAMRSLRLRPVLKQPALLYLRVEYGLQASLERTTGFRHHGR